MSYNVGQKDWLYIVCIFTLFVIYLQNLIALNLIAFLHIFQRERKSSTIIELEIKAIIDLLLGK